VSFTQAGNGKTVIWTTSNAFGGLEENFAVRYHSAAQGLLDGSAA
jgi:hypothetical protein